MFEEFVPLALIFGVLGYISIHDLKYRNIPFFTIYILFALTPIYLYLSSADFTTASLCFMFSFGVFTVFFILGRGGFGFGDVIIIAIIGWVVADFGALETYMYILGACLLVWWVICIIWYKKKLRCKGWLHGFRRTVNTKELKPGMVLNSDNFMHGLNEKKIKDIQGKFDEIDIKEPMPFIPAVFISIIIFFVYTGVV